MTVEAVKKLLEQNTICANILKNIINYKEINNVINNKYKYQDLERKFSNIIGIQENILSNDEESFVFFLSSIFENNMSKEFSDTYTKPALCISKTSNNKIDYNEINQIFSSWTNNTNPSIDAVSKESGVIKVYFKHHVKFILFIERVLLIWQNNCELLNKKRGKNQVIEKPNTSESVSDNSQNSLFQDLKEEFSKKINELSNKEKEIDELKNDIKKIHQESEELYKSNEILLQTLSSGVASGTFKEASIKYNSSQYWKLFSIVILSISMLIISYFILQGFNIDNLQKLNGSFVSLLFYTIPRIFPFIISSCILKFLINSYHQDSERSVLFKRQQALADVMPHLQKQLTNIEKKEELVIQTFNSLNSSNFHKKDTSPSSSVEINKDVQKNEEITKKD